MYGFILNPESQYRPLAESFLTMYLQMESSKLKSLFDAQGRYSAFEMFFISNVRKSKPVNLSIQLEFWKGVRRRYKNF